jgi:hypothetical protein
MPHRAKRFEKLWQSARRRSFFLDYRDAGLDYRDAGLGYRGAGEQRIHLNRFQLRMTRKELIHV